MAAKIKDGLFIGDAETSQSEIFINDNKISNLINLSGREVNNIWAPHGLVYLTYFWEDRPDYKIFNTHEDSMLKDIVEFIDVSISHGISVLLFSSHGTGRCAIAACIYLMMKYRWGFEKTYDYVYSKKPDINLNKGFIQQMFALDMKLLSARQKTYALKYGIDSSFKIEANMTINDISAMLPSNEAKRWNAWEPDYIIITGNNGVDSNNNNNNHSIVSSKDQLEESKDYDAKSDYKRSRNNKYSTGQSSSGSLKIYNTLHDDETSSSSSDELLLVYSFLNSKNTITSLPGPYPHIYDTPKSFKIRFNSICYEEDVNWFPPTPSSITVPTSNNNNNNNNNTIRNSNHHHVNNNKVGLPRSALKGSRNKEKQQQMMMMMMSSDSNGVTTINAQPKTSKHNHAFDSGASSKQLSSRGSNISNNSVDFKSIYPEENITTISMNLNNMTNNNQRRDRRDNNNNNQHGSSTHSSSSSSSQQQQQQQQNHQISSDLYEFVGITNTDPTRSSRVNKASSSRNSSSSNNSNIVITASTDHIDDLDVDDTSLDVVDLSTNSNNISNNNNIHHHHHGAGFTGSNNNIKNKNNLNNNFNNSVTAEERLRNLMTDMQRHKPTSSGSRDNDNKRDVPPTATTATANSNNHTAIVGPSLYELATMKLPTTGLNGVNTDPRLQMADYEMDELLYAFDKQLHSTSGSNKANVIRARHDIVTQNSNRSNSSNGSSNNSQNNSNGGRSNAISPANVRPGPKSAWVGPINQKTALPGSNSRPASPSPGQNLTQQQGSGITYSNPNPSPNNNSATTVPSRFNSPSTSRPHNGGASSSSAAAAANNSSLSINSVNSNNASGSNNIVGTGMNSATKVYR